MRMDRYAILSILILSMPTHIHAPITMSNKHMSGLAPTARSWTHLQFLGLGNAQPTS